jgi:hypothetical protein
MVIARVSPSLRSHVWLIDPTPMHVIVTVLLALLSTQTVNWAQVTDPGTKLTLAEIPKSTFRLIAVGSMR